MRRIVIVLFLFGVGSQPMGIGQGGQKKAPVMKRDLPFIACQTCKELIHYSYDGVHELRLDSKPGKPVNSPQPSNADSTFLGKRVGYLWTAGECLRPWDRRWRMDRYLWSRGIRVRIETRQTRNSWAIWDVVVIIFVFQIGFCESECRTIARACSDLIEEFDYSLAEALFANEANEEQLFQRFCHKVSNVCAKPTPPLPKVRYSILQSLTYLLILYLGSSRRSTVHSDDRRWL